MAGTLVSDYGVGDVDLTALMDTVTKQRVDFEAVTLTNHDNDSEPAIAAGSLINVNGALYNFSTENSISGSPADGVIYIKFVASGSSCTPTFTASAPSWSDAKQGWYDGNDRYLYRLRKDGSAYYDKTKLVHEQWPDYLKPLFVARNAEDLDLDGTAKTQRVIYCRNLHVTANTTLKARTVWIDGDFIIDSVPTLTLGGLEYNPINVDTTSRNPLVGDRPGKGERSGNAEGGIGGFWGGVGTDGTDDAEGGGGGGGFGTGGKGHSSSGPAGGVSNGINIGNGGYGTTRTGGGGACGAGGGCAGVDGGNPGAGGDITIFIVKGNFINNGTLTNDGGDGEETSGYTHGGGGGGLIVILAFGHDYVGGTINCNGGDSTLGSQDGGGGGGGYIGIAARTSSFGTLNVNGGSGTDNGDAGVTETIDIDTNPLEALGAAAADADAIMPKLIKYFLEGGI